MSTATVVFITTARRARPEDQRRCSTPDSDAVPGNINLSIGNGQADFAAGLRSLAAHGYTGHFSLELETRDVTNDERPAAAAKAASFLTDLI